MNFIFNKFGLIFFFKIESQIWCSLKNEEKSAIMHDLMQRLENANSSVRLDAARILLYILQVIFLNI